MWWFRNHVLWVPETPFATHSGQDYTTKTTVAHWISVAVYSNLRLHISVQGLKHMYMAWFLYGSNCFFNCNIAIFCNSDACNVPQSVRFEGSKVLLRHIYTTDWPFQQAPKTRWNPARRAHPVLLAPLYREIISMSQCKKDATPLLTHWSYVFLALTHRFVRSPRFDQLTSAYY